MVDIIKIRKDFRELRMPVLLKDKHSIEFEWGIYIDSLCREEVITPEEYHNLDSFLIPIKMEQNKLSCTYYYNGKARIFFSKIHCNLEDDLLFGYLNNRSKSSNVKRFYFESIMNTEEIKYSFYNCILNYYMGAKNGLE